jgi:capsular polysaccharide biosynthesis protein
MELRQLARILLRRWWLILLPAIVLGAAAVITYDSPPQSYGATMRFAVGYTPDPNSQSLYDRFYPAWLASEYIAGGLSDWAKTGDFAEAVSDDLAARGVDASASQVAASIVSDHSRSIVTLYFNGGDPGLLQSIAESAARVLQARNATVFPQSGPNGASVKALDSAAIGPTPPSLRARLDLPMRIGLAISVGVVLALVAHYLDPMVRERRDVEALGWPILGEIPKSK